MAKTKGNDNYLHACNEDKVEIANYKKSIIDAGLSKDDLDKILRVFLFGAPTLKNSKDTNGFNKRLRDYGWGVSGYDRNKLERALLKNSSINSFVVIKSNSIAETRKIMNFESKMCVSHERILLKQNGSAVINELNEYSFDEKEDRMQCLFRHIRNSLAHNRTYLFENGFIFLEDIEGESEAVTACILVNLETLLRWADVLEKEGKHDG